MRDAVIVASSRTPLAKSHRGSFKDTRPDDLAAHVIRHVLGKAPAVDLRGIDCRRLAEHMADDMRREVVRPRVLERSPV